MDCVCVQLHSDFIRQLTSYPTYEYVEADQSKFCKKYFDKTYEVPPSPEYKAYWGNHDMVWRKETVHDVTPVNIEKYIPHDNVQEIHDKQDNCTNLPWKHCSVGSLAGTSVDTEIRFNTFQVEAKPSFDLSDAHINLKIENALKLLYPQNILAMSKVKLSKLLAPYLDGPRKYYDSYESDDDYNDRDYDTPEYPSQKVTREFILLAYKTGGFFKEHSDSRTGLVFATTLLFCPTKLTGGDLVLRIPADRVHDPDNLLLFKDDMTILEVGKITAPVLISFRTSVPHQVAEVTSGFRICLKTSQYLPTIATLFDNTVPTYLDFNVHEIIRTARLYKCKNEIAAYQEKVDKLTTKIKLLTDKMQLLEDSGEDSDEDSAEDSDDERPQPLPVANITSNMIVIMTTGPKQYTKCVEITPELLGKFTTREIAYIHNVIRKYPYSTIRIEYADRPRVSHDLRIYSQNDVENMCNGSGTGDLRIHSLPKHTEVKYFDDPDKVSIGCKQYTRTAYNDTNYSGYDEVLVYALCIQINNDL